MVNAKSLANLRPFRKGDGRKRGVSPGRPRVSLVTVLRNRLAEHPEEADAIIDSLVKMSLGKDIAAIREAFDRIDGKAKGETEVSGKIVIEVERVSRNQNQG